MESIVMQARLREGIRKGATKKLRAKGLLPAVLYGGDVAPVNIQVDSRTIEKIVSKEQVNAILDVQVEGGEKTLAMIKEIQKETISRKLVHMDLVRISMDKKVQVRVPVILHNAEDLKKKGGIVQLLMNEIEIESLPNMIPDHIHVDLAGMDVGHAVLVRDLPVAEGIEFMAEEDEAVVTILAPKVEKTKAELAAEAAESAEGEEGEKKEESKEKEQKEKD